MKKVTALGMIVSCVILIIVEVYALLTPEGGDTISEITNKLINDYPIVLYVAGIITGHIIWPLTMRVQEFIRKEHDES